MSRTRTLTNLISDVRQRTNQENSTFVTDAELTEYLNQELAELWTHLFLNEGQPHQRSSSTITVTSGTALYTLPSDFWTMQEVTATIGSDVVPIHPFMPLEHAYLQSAGASGAIGPVCYRVQANNIEFLPTNATFVATLFYTPCAPRLVAPSDTWDGFNGYEMAPIYGVCATVKDKGGEDPSFYAMQKDKLYQQVIDAAAARRDNSHPERIQDVRDRSGINALGLSPGILGGG